MPKYKCGVKYQEETCKNCKFCVGLNLNLRVLKEVVKENCLTGFTVDTRKDRYQESFCCTALHIDDAEAPIYETTLNDHCEKFERKYEGAFRNVYDIDNSSMYYVPPIIEFDFPVPKFDREKYAEVLNERKALKNKENYEKFVMGKFDSDKEVKEE